MHRMNVEGSMLGGLGAFHAGVANYKARRAAYVEAVIEARDREALHRRIRALEAQLAARQRQADQAEVDRRMRAMLRGLKG